MSIYITHWHSHTRNWQTKRGTISVPISGRIRQIAQILLWDHPYIDIESFIQSITAHQTTINIQSPVSLDSDIRALDASLHRFNLHLLLPHWEAGHSGRTPQSKKEDGSPPDVGLTSRQDATLSPHILDLGATLGRSGKQIIGAHKMTPYP